MTLTVTAPATPGTVTNTASISSTTNDPVSGNNQDTATTTVNSAADIALGKSVSPATVDLGANATWTIAVQNLGPQAASNVVITDPVPARFQPLSASGSGWACSIAGQNVNCTRPSLASGASAPIALVTKAMSVGNATNTCTKSATEADANPSNDTCSASAAVVDHSNIVVTKSAPAIVLTGAPITWTITVDNQGPSVATNVVVTDTIPNGVTGITPSAPAPWSCSVSGQTVTCTAAVLPVGQSQIQIAGTAPTTAGSMTNTCVATANTGTPDVSNCRTSTDTKKGPDLEITKSHAPSAFTVGTLATYTITARNVGDQDSTGVYTVIDALPVGLTYSGSSGTGWSCNAAGRL